MLKGQNTESSEQTFRWLSRFKVLARPMTQGRFNFFVLRMAHRHNLRTVAAHKRAVLTAAVVADTTAAAAAKKPRGGGTAR